MTEHRKFFELISDDTYDVSDVQMYERVSNSCTKHERHHGFLRHHSRQTGVVQLLGAVERSCSVL